MTTPIGSVTPGFSGRPPRTGLTYSIDRSGLRARSITLEVFARPTAPIVLAAPVLQNAPIVREAIASVRAFLAKAEAATAWLDDLASLLAPDDAARDVALDVSATLRLLEGLADLADRAQTRPRGVCPPELLDAWSVLESVAHDVSLAIDRAVLQSVDGTTTALVRRATPVTIALPDDARASQHAFGGAPGADLPHCSCGQPLQVHLRFDTRDPGLQLLDVGVPFIELLFCESCDAQWNDPPLRYRQNTASVEVFSQPEGCIAQRTHGALPRARVALGDSIRAPHAHHALNRIHGDAPAHADPRDHACPVCQRTQAFFASLAHDPELGVCLLEGHALAWWWCPDCVSITGEMIVCR